MLSSVEIHRKWHKIEVVLKKAKTCTEWQNHKVRSDICCLQSPHPFYLASKLGHTIYRRNSIQHCDVGRLPPLGLRVEIGRTEYRIASRSLPKKHQKLEKIKWKKELGKHGVNWHLLSWVRLLNAYLDVISLFFLMQCEA